MFWLVFVEFVGFVGFRPGWLLLSMGTSALQLRHLLLLLPAVLDLLFLGWYLLNLLLLLCSGLARQCLCIATQVKGLLVLLAAL